MLFEALEPVRQGVRECFEVIGERVATGLTIRHDNGSQSIGRDLLWRDLWGDISGAKSLGQGSPRRRPLSVPEESNGYAERFIRTLKGSLLWLKPLWTIEALQQALQEFKDRYNRLWLIERHGQRSPSQFRRWAVEEGRWTKPGRPHKIRKCLDNPRTLHPEGRVKGHSRRGAPWWAGNQPSLHKESVV